MDNKKRLVSIEETQEPAFEIWRDIAGYEGAYQVSNFGRIRSLNYRMIRGNVQVLKIHPDAGGYLRAKLCKQRRETTVKVHRVVAEAFIPNPEKKREVNHKDGNTMNNTVSNLEWVTPSENMKHASKIGSVVSPRIFPVEQRKPNGELVRIWESARAAGIATGACPSQITKCCKGKAKTTHGYMWEYHRQSKEEN